VPPNYRQQQGEPLKSHERKGAVLLVSLVALTAAGISTWQLTSSTGGAKGRCVTVTVAGSTGGEEVHQCGRQARSWCASEDKAVGPVAAEARAACKRAGFLAH
jgi:hypothetical protein